MFDADCKTSRGKGFAVTEIDEWRNGGIKMPRRNFLQILHDAQIDIKREYQRLFDLFYTQSAPDYNGRY